MKQWPWRDMQVGDAFFVACLNHEAVKREGLRHAARAGVNGAATPAIRNGLYGLLFIRLSDRALSLVVPKRSRSSLSRRDAPASPQDSGQTPRSGAS